MIKPEDIYRASNGGLDIILTYYPQARDCIGSNKKFKRRASETDASACLKEYNGVWKVTDFGEDATALSPIDICMREEGLRFSEAIAKLAGVYNVRDELNRSVNKPIIKKMAALQSQKDGEKYFEMNESFSASELKIMGPNVTQEIADSLHWYSAKYVCDVKNREATYKYSTDTYPIFMRECLVSKAEGNKPEVKFYKIYEPCNPEKQWRFQYTPKGVKPREYINGLAELKERYRKYNADEEALFFQDPRNEDKPYKEKKLPEAFICSGERDAICVAALGYPPLWMNSETYKLSESEYKEIMKYVEVLYNIPDLDTTGIRKGKELALRFIDIHTIWLPKWLNSYKDNRGNPRKDFRDFSELRSKPSDFTDLKNLALPAKFWTQAWNEKKKNYSYEIDSECLAYFLKLYGFYTLKDENSDATRFIRIDGSVVKKVKPKTVKSFLRQWMVDTGRVRDLRNLIRNSARVSDSAFEDLEEIELDFTNYTSDSQFFFFKNSCYEVKGDDIKEYTQGEQSGRYVWEDNVLPHRIKLLPDMFTIKRHKDMDGENVFDIHINNVPSNIFGYIINSSRIHWRKELEYNFEDKSYDESIAYRHTHKFCIDGEGLSKEEVQEQKQNLIAKLFTIGYMLHRYKSPSKAWAPQAMDNKIGEEGECNGRSGKSFIFKALAKLNRTVVLSGRNPKLMDNQHLFEQVDQYTDTILVDDCNQYLSTDQFYDMITGDLSVNPKNNRQFTLPFETSPKFAFTTNYVPRDFHSSTEARLLYMVFSDYYHQKTADNDYLETRSIRDDFGHDLFTNTYSEDEWSSDINFFMQCCRFYLSLAGENIKIQPPMGNILRRKYKQDMGENFEEWANIYFANIEGNDHLDHLLVREDVFADYRQFANVNKMTMQRFTKSLRGFVALNDYIVELNPQEYCNTAGRIVRKNKEGKSSDMIYIRTTLEAQKERKYISIIDNEEFTAEPF